MIDKFGVEYSENGEVLIKCPTSIEGEYVIPQGVTSIEEGAFHQCRTISSITIPNSVKSIGRWAFDGCISLTSVTIPDSVVSIGDHAFCGCDALNSITIPKSVKSIKEGAFAECENLSAVYITDLAAWCNISFEASYGRDEVSNPLYYAKHLFLNNKEIYELIIPNTIDSIGDYAFYNCNSLTSIIIPTSVKNIGQCVFDGCCSCRHIEYGGWIIDCERCRFEIDIIEEVPYLKGDFDGEKHIYFPDSVTTINMNASYYELGYQHVPFRGTNYHYFIPKSVKEIEYEDSEGTTFQIDNYIENIEIKGVDKWRDRRFVFRAPKPNEKPVMGKTLELTLTPINHYYQKDALWSSPVTLHSFFVAYIHPQHMECFEELNHQGCRIVFLARGGELRTTNNEVGFPYIDVWENYEFVLNKLNQAGWALE